MKYLLLALSSALAGCAYSIKEINTDGREPECIRECAAVYSSCVSTTHQIGSKFETLRACQSGYSVCVNTCP